MSPPAPRRTLTVRSGGGGHRRGRGASRVESAGVRRREEDTEGVDQPGMSTMSTVPLWASTTDLAMASPSPGPGTPCSDGRGQAVEALEQVGCSPSGMPGPVSTCRGGRSRPAPRPRPSTRPPGRELHGVGQQVAEQLVQADRVADPAPGPTGLSTETVTAASGGRLQGCDRLGRPLAADRGRRRPPAARAATGIGQQVVGHLAELLAEFRSMVRSMRVWSWLSRVRPCRAGARRIPGWR